MKILKNKWANSLLNKQIRMVRKLDSSISEILINCHSLLIIYPNNSLLKDSADSAQKLFFDFFGDIKIHTIHPELISNDQLRWNGLPKNGLHNSFHQSFDIAFDLNMEFDLISSYMLSQFQCKLNIRMYASEQADNLYHVSIYQKNQDFKSRFENVFYYLNCLKEEKIFQI